MYGGLAICGKSFTQETNILLCESLIGDSC